MTEVCPNCGAWCLALHTITGWCPACHQRHYTHPKPTTTPTCICGNPCDTSYDGRYYRHECQTCRKRRRRHARTRIPNPAICTHPTCPLHAQRRGLCWRHYRQAKKEAA